MARHIPRIISAIVGLVLVGLGAWLAISGHADTGSLVILGGLGTLGLPSALPARRQPASSEAASSQSASDTLPMLVCVIASSAGLLGSSCSSGPQLPIVTTPISISCTWHAPDSGAIEDCDCLIDRASAPTTSTTGNDARGARVDTAVEVDASGR